MRDRFPCCPLGRMATALRGSETSVVAAEKKRGESCDSPLEARLNEREDRAGKGSRSDCNRNAALWRTTPNVP